MAAVSDTVTGFPSRASRSTGAGAPSLFRAPFDRRTWARYGYLVVAATLAPLALGYVIVAIVLSPFLTVSLIGLFGLAALVAGARGWGVLYRGLARSFVGTDVPAPPPRRPVSGFWRRLGTALVDPVGWRALVFMLVMAPLSLLGALLSTALLLAPIGLATHWIWGPLTPPREMSDGTVVRSGLMLGPETAVVTLPQHLLVTAIGVLLWFGWPWIVRPVTTAMARLSRALLGPTRASQRVAELERSRAGTVEDADARLRRIERDLHDGTQARLVAIAMQLGEVKDHLATGGDPVQVQDLIGTAHASSTEALTELRELARGIHPPVLDDGLTAALETLAARAPLPVALDVDPALTGGGAPAPAVESIAYFTVAELVTNAAKHASASGVSVLVRRAEQALLVKVHDDGHGGAALLPPSDSGHRSGLTGLAERARSLDGSLDVHSPAGGPTVVTVRLPEIVRR